MKPHEVLEIAQCLPKGKTPFYYFKDRYALWLLAHYLGNGKRIRDVKASRFGSLLQKPILKPVLQHCASGTISAHDVLSASRTRPEPYLLGLGAWGGRGNRRDTWYQTSRPGKNLVLRLNFTSKHDVAHDRVIGPERSDHPLEFHAHPVAKEKHHTLAWARCDIDLDNGEALIEEIQNDWLRSANRQKRLLDRLSSEGRARYLERRYRDGVRNVDIERYFDDVLRPHHATWDEATLTATLWFLREELGVRRIFYNTWETGCRFKGISRDYGPPKSIYSTLPRKFCFEETNEPPAFLGRYWARRLRTHPERASFRWFHLDL